jgi:hypothetical protein
LVKYRFSLNAPPNADEWSFIFGSYVAFPIIEIIRGIFLISISSYSVTLDILDFG